jgi:multiple sugar transport system permease protein
MNSQSERRHLIQNSRLAYKVLLPSLIFVFVFIALPMFYSISIAFTDYKYGVPTGKGFVLKNFIDIFTNSTIAPIFYKSLKVTFEFATIAVVAVVIISLAIALLLNERFRGSNVIKVALLLPYALPGVVGAVIWKWIYNPTFGILDYVLQSLGIIKNYIAFTADPHFALYTILFAYVWKFVPYSTFLFTAGLSTIPKSVYEAARMDGSSTFNTFWKITVPLLMPVFQLVLVIQTIFALVYHFSLLYIITRGGPGDATRTLAWLIYNESFSFGRYGRGAAEAVILALIMIFFIYLYLVVLDPERRAARKQARVKKGIVTTGAPHV